MKSFHKHLLVAVMAIGIGSSAIAADAMMCDQMGSGQGRGMGMMGADGPNRAQSAERMKARMEKRQTALHHKLKLNAEQEVAWKEFTAAKTPPAMGMRMNRAEMMKLSAPDRMEKMLGFMKERQAHMTVKLVELKKFYAVLTPEQQKIFDAETMGPRHGGKHGRTKGQHKGHRASAAATK
jgi:hypothetical protein